MSKLEESIGRAATKIAEEEISAGATEGGEETSFTLWIWTGIIVLVILALIGIWYKVKKE